MRRLLTDAPMARCKTLLIHSGQTAAFAAVAVFAAAAAPNAAREAALPPPTQIAAPVSPPLKAEVEKAVTGAREAIQAGDLSRIKAATERLTQAAARMAEGGPAAKGPSADPEIVDAEFEDAPGDAPRHRPAA